MKNNNQNFLCPECGSITEKFNEGLTTGIKCTECSWSVATTYIPPIEKDHTLYELKIQNGDHKNKNQIKIISKISGVNFLEARNLLKQENPTIFKGNAIEIKKIKSILEKENITTNIQPNFTWQ